LRPDDWHNLFDGGFRFAEWRNFASSPLDRAEIRTHRQFGEGLDVQLQGRDADLLAGWWLLRQYADGYVFLIHFWKHDTMHYRWLDANRIEFDLHFGLRRELGHTQGDRVSY
jgi:hypothetical protein